MLKAMKILKKKMTSKILMVLELETVAWMLIPVNFLIDVLSFAHPVLPSHCSICAIY